MQFKRLIYWSSFWAILLALTRAHGAAAPFTVETWQKGLPSKEIVAITQTDEGYLWLGTSYGLVRFDGLHFTSFFENNTPGLTENEIAYLFEDSRSNFWVGGQSGEIFLMKNGRVNNLGIKRESGSGKLISACEDKSGAIWFYTVDGQLCRYQDGKLNGWRVAGGSERSTLSHRMICDTEGIIWVANENHIFKINPAKVGVEKNDLPVEQTIQLNYPLDFMLARSRGGFWIMAGGKLQKFQGNAAEDWGNYPWNKPVFTACEDRQGNLIVGTLGDGIWWFEDDKKARHLTSENGLSHNYILSLLIDREDTLWVGTDGGGLNRLKHQAFTVLPATQSLTVQSVAVEQGTNLWINTKGGLLHWSAGGPELFGASQGLLNTNGQVAFVSQKGEVWAGAGGPAESPGLFQLTGDHFQSVPGSQFLNQVVQVIYEAPGGAIWVGTQAGLASLTDGQWNKVYKLKDGLSSETIQALASDGAGNLWVGTHDGLNVLRAGQFQTFHEKDGLPGENISSLLFDKTGVLWVGTHGRGLGRYFNGKWTRFTTAVGLPSNNVNYLLEDLEDDLWLGSNTGLLRLRKKELQAVADGLTNYFSCRTYAESDGLLSSECSSGSQPAAVQTSDGRLWFPTIQGLITVEPAQIKLNTNPPPVVIEGVLIDGISIQSNAPTMRLPAQVVIPPARERLEIQFASLNLATAEKARFRYRLRGHETGWTETDANIRAVSYTRLPAGEYVFQVTACNEDEIWNERGASLAVIVEPPFWKTWWFRLSLVLISLGLVAGIVSYYSTQRLQGQLAGMRQQQALEKERARIARDIHDQLGASMTQVSLLGEMVESDKDDPKEVAAHARQISQTARDTSRVLDEIVWTVNPSNDTLDGLINYICKYAQEYFAVAELRFRLDIPAQLPALIISPEVRHNVFLAAKESVTNVVRHAKASEVWLRLQLRAQEFVLELQDNGRGPVGLEAKQSRNGLRNLRKRMEDVGGSFELVPGPQGGAIARLTVPFQNK